ncbi:trypsin-like peptidase domain-containing protein [Clavibacter sepedonicus]|uniref:Pat-1 homologue n=1 Tax=Clavibacter sepedonicus TaxID=31964 RepID=B0RHG1_CLASE|nr:trypsin-like peptidase domain-containing protein [Clavibacter sepedonicus]UUK66637.1 S1 family peptidase [Clavibacter sepedonicus]CAQ01378.1 putative pat-1 homologue [Clavibacter sepedonicus]
MTALAAAALVLTTGAAPASAVSPLRLATPVMAGSQIRNASGYKCTAGAVLKYDRWTTYFNSWEGATRYVVTAAHCGDLNENVTLGSSVPGKVIWRDELHDLELIVVSPSTERAAVCSHTSAGEYCRIVLTYHPQAVGRIITRDDNTWREQRTPLVATGEPDDRVFCVSAIRAGVACGLVRTTTPAAIAAVHPGIRAAEDRSLDVQPGDSGGPVMSRSGTLYGFVSGGGIYGGVRKIDYMPWSVFAHLQPNYVLAPAG